MTCGDLRDLLSAFVDGEVGPAQREWLELHLERCSVCQDRVAGYRRVRQLLAVLPADAWVPPAVPARPRGPASRPRVTRPDARLRSLCAALVVGLAAGAAGTLVASGQLAMAPRPPATALPPRPLLHHAGAPHAARPPAAPTGAWRGPDPTIAALVAARHHAAPSVALLTLRGAGGQAPAERAVMTGLSGRGGSGFAAGPGLGRRGWVAWPI